MNPRARRLRRLRRESKRKAWRANARRAKVVDYIQSRIAAALDAPLPRFVDVVPWPGTTRTTLDTHTGNVELVMKASMSRIFLSIKLGEPAITCETTSTPEDLLKRGVIETTITMPVPPGFTLAPVTE